MEYIQWVDHIHPQPPCEPVLNTMVNIAQPKSFLQSKDWFEFQRSLGREVFSLGDTGVIEIPTWFNKKYFYIPRGPNALSNEFVDKLLQKAKDRKAIFILAEPQEDSVAQILSHHGFSFSTSKDIQPNRTIVLSLVQDDDELLKKMHHKTRYNIKVARRDGVVVRTSDDIEPFLELLSKTSARDKFFPHSSSYYRSMFSFFQKTEELQINIFYAYLDDRPVAAAMIGLYGKRGFYLHGASDHECRSSMAPFALHWEVISWLKVHDYDHYDFWGIDHQRYPGVTRFKLGWGGNVIEYPGAFVMPISKIYYALYSFLRKLKSYIH